jgi:hypothetical protein
MARTTAYVVTECGLKITLDRKRIDGESVWMFPSCVKEEPDDTPKTRPQFSRSTHRSWGRKRSGPKTRKELFKETKERGYRSEGSLSNALRRVGAISETKGGYQGVTLYRLPPEESQTEV